MPLPRKKVSTQRVIRWSFVCGFWHVAVPGFDGAGWVEGRAGALSLTKMCGQDLDAHQRKLNMGVQRKWSGDYLRLLQPQLTVDADNVLTY
jgi:hypothetical protein